MGSYPLRFNSGCNNGVLPLRTASIRWAITEPSAIFPLRQS